MELPSRASLERLPPGNGAANSLAAPVATTVGVAAVAIDTGITKGGAFVSIQAQLGDMWYRTGAATGTGTTSANGRKIPQDTTEEVWITPASRFIDIIASVAACRAITHLSSPNYANRT